MNWLLHLFTIRSVFDETPVIHAYGELRPESPLTRVGGEAPGRMQVVWVGLNLVPSGGFSAVFEAAEDTRTPLASLHQVRHRWSDHRGCGPNGVT